MTGWLYKVMICTSQFPSSCAIFHTVLLVLRVGYAITLNLLLINVYLFRHLYNQLNRQCTLYRSINLSKHSTVFSGRSQNKNCRVQDRGCTHHLSGHTLKLLICSKAEQFNAVLRAWRLNA